MIDEILVRFWNFKFVTVHWCIVFEVYFVFKISGQTQVIFILTDGLLVFKKNVYVSLFVFTRHV